MYTGVGWADVPLFFCGKWFAMNWLRGDGEVFRLTGRRRRQRFLIDFGTDMSEHDAALYQLPFEYIRHNDMSRGRRVMSRALTQGFATSELGRPFGFKGVSRLFSKRVGLTVRPAFCARFRRRCRMPYFGGAHEAEVGVFG